MNLNNTEFKILLQNKLCDVVDILLAYYNPCGIKVGGICNSVTGKVFCCHNTNYESVTGGCVFLSDKGCKVKSLGCKVWLCNEIFDSIPRELKLTLKAIEIVDRVFQLSSYAPEHLLDETKGYQISDTLRYFDEER